MVQKMINSFIALVFIHNTKTNSSHPYSSLVVQLRFILAMLITSICLLIDFSINEISLFFNKEISSIFTVIVFFLMIQLVHFLLKKKMDTSIMLAEISRIGEMDISKWKTFFLLIIIFLTLVVLNIFLYVLVLGS